MTHSFSLPNSQLIAGTLDGASDTIYRIDFYLLNAPPPAWLMGRGDGGLISGFSAFATDAAGHSSFLISESQVQVGGWLSAATTPLFGDTSEIGNAVADQSDGIFVEGFGGINACQ